MKVIVKRRHGTRWQPIKLEELVGKSILCFMLDSKDDIVSALHDDEDKPVAFISNSDKYVDMYKSKGLSMSAQELRDLMGTEVFPPIVLEVFPGATLAAVKKADG